VAGAHPRVYQQTTFDETWGRFSPQSPPRWMAYVSDESGRDEVYIRAFPDPQGKWRVSTGGGEFPEWSPDGRELYYVSPQNKLMAVSLKFGIDAVEPAAPRELFGLPGERYMSAYPYAVAPDGKRFLARVTVQDANQPLRVILNWPALLK
jgi:eukaryotic-like serine/threonine-protein kinase